MKITLSLFLIASSLYSFGQIPPEVILPAFTDKYCETVEKLEKGETDIDYRAFRESFIESEQFRVAGRRFHEFDSLKKVMYAEMNRNNYQEIIKATKGMLSIDYTSMRAHKILQQTYKIIGDTINKKKYHDIEFGLLNSIVRNGDGKTCETAWPVIQLEEEYFILDMIDADLKKQSIDNDGGFCDRMVVKTDKGKKTYYFAIGKVFEGYKKRENKKTEE